MENSIHLSQKREVRNHSQENKDLIAVLAARYISDFSIAITFSSGKTQLVNFLPLFEKNVKGENLKYYSPGRFKNFIVKNGNIYWGRNEDVVFPTSDLLKESQSQADTSDEILYII